MRLLERDVDHAALASALDASRAEGRVVVVAGDAGIGKTALVASACDALRPRRVLWGACDPLLTPRPMGPLREEDLHWADDATLDLVALLGRRLARARGCIVLTCRSDALGTARRSAASSGRSRARSCPASSRRRCRRRRCSGSRASSTAACSTCSARGPACTCGAGCAPKTVDHHVSAVLSKLGVTTRREAAEAEQGLGVAP